MKQTAAHSLDQVCGISDKIGEMVNSIQVGCRIANLSARIAILCLVHFVEPYVLGNTIRCSSYNSQVAACFKDQFGNTD